ncbi:MAG: DnaK suppressor protein [Candidatus Azotimanducaceae bacterium]|jgi:DnaK suppressor protein
MSEALTKQQLQILGSDLVALQASLEQLLIDTEVATKPVNLKDNQGRLSRMDEMHNQSILLANRNLTKNRLRAVISALQRFELSQYGECLECGEDVAFSRLKAYPEADMCIVCQQLQESSS